LDLESAAADTKSRLRDLTTAYAAIDAVAGFEQALVRRLVQDFRPLVDDVTVDSFGNVIASRFADEHSPTLMISAHSDEIGAVVKAVEDGGFLRFAPIGGVLESLLVGRAVRVNGHPGVIGSRAGHIASAAERITAPAMKDLYVDLGFDSATEVLEAGIRVGDPIAYDAPVRALANPDRISGKAIDNRVGCAIVVELARRLQESQLAATVHFVVAVQEEVGLRGAQIVTYRLNPTAAIVLDTMPAGGTPDVSSTRELTQALGAGPVITLISQSGRAGAIAHPGMVRLLERAAQRANTPCQRGVFYGGNSDAAAVHLVRSGVPTGILNLARRYSHSPVETLDLNDAAHALELLVVAATGYDSRADLSFLGADALIDET
jgi:putative aminopeptidase FrvX